jgi:hypothetical protein
MKIVKCGLLTGIIFTLFLFPSCTNPSNSGDGTGSNNGAGSSSGIKVLIRNTSSSNHISYISIYSFDTEEYVYTEGRKSTSADAIIDPGKEITITLDAGSYRANVYKYYGRINYDYFVFFDITANTTNILEL